MSSLRNLSYPTPYLATNFRQRIMFLVERLKKNTGQIKCNWRKQKTLLSMFSSLEFSYEIAFKKNHLQL